MLEIKKLSFDYSLNKSKKQVLDDVSVCFYPGFNVILGPNGAGKSTLLKCIFSLLKAEGQILFNGEDISRLNVDQKIQFMSYLPQNDSDYSCMRAIEVVLLGRLSQLGRKVRQEDLDIVLGIMKSLNIEDLAMRKINELSGGQRKLVYIAQTLVGKPQVLLMDEPANSLDLQKQLELCQLLRKLVIKNNINLLVVLHDLNLAARYADQVVVFNEKGTIYGSGPVKEVFTEKMLLDVYGVRAHLVTDETGIPVVSPIASVRLNQVVG